jgi:hypothetical protein
MTILACPWARIALACLIALGSANVTAAARTSANYSQSIEVLDAGGGTGASPSYGNHGSVGGMGDATASGSYSADAGYLPQTLGESLPPAGGTMTLAPASPVDASMALTVGFTAWTDGSLPLNYTVLIDNVVVSASGAAASRNITGPAAPGSYTLKGKIADALGNVTEVTQSFTVNTAQETWRFTYFGTTANTGNAADLADPDGDGHDNAFEFVAGLVPNDLASRFTLRIEPVAEEPGQKAIIFRPRLTDRGYVLKYKLSLTDAVWLTVPNITTSDDGDERTVTDLDASGGARFYQVEITRP